jgi:DNA primase
MPRSQSVSPSAPTLRAEQLELIQQGDDLHLTIDPRSYRVRGLERNLSTHQLRVNVLATRDDLVHLDTFDLYKANARATFIKATAAELYCDVAVIKRDISMLLLKLEQRQWDLIEATTRPDQPVELSDQERDEALTFLRDPHLMGHIEDDHQALGLVGETTNKLICYLACVSRLLNQPLAVLIQSSSAAGKTSLMDATLSLIPPDYQVRYSAMTGQSLYYMGREDLKHKILAVAEEEGVAQASYALKLLQSDGKLRIAAAGKNAGSGRQQTESYEVEGPVMMFLTTTAELPDTELQNRCLTLHVNESPQQTAAIHAQQRTAYTLAGQTQSQLRETIRQRHQNAQRLLEPLPVILPWAEQLTFRDDQTRMRRDHAKYLSLIASIALLHQHQRQRKALPEGKGEYIEATVDDAKLANCLLSEVMGQAIDALLPQTRQLWENIRQYVAKQARRDKKPQSLVRFTQRQLRESTGWGDFQVRKHLIRLVELEYVLAFRSGCGNQREYQLLDGRQCGGQFVAGLVDPQKLQQFDTA